MSGYVSVAFPDDDPDALLAAALQRIAVTLPGWTPRETHVEYAVLSEAVRLILDTRILAADVADSIFRTYGQKLIGLPPQPGTPATGTAVFTFTDTSSRTVPAGTQLLWPASGDPVLFQTVNPVSNPSGSVTTAPVQITAVRAGRQGNDLTPQPLTLVDALSFVVSVAATTTSADGTDAERDEDYLDRLADSLRLLRRIPVLAQDFAVLTRDVPGVHRALALDNYDPATDTSNNERTVAVAAVAQDGGPVPSQVRDTLDLLLQEQREVNFVVKVFDPTYTALTITFTGIADADADPVAVRAAVIAALRDYLSPAVWAGGDQEPPTWRPGQSTVGYLDLAGVAASAAGLSRLTDLTINGGRVDVTLAGAAPLPAANPTITGTVTGP